MVKSSQSHKGVPVISLLIYVSVSLCVIFSLFPIFYLGVTSIKSYKALYATPPKFFIFQASLENYEMLWNEGSYSFFVNSLIVATTATFLSLFLGALLAYGFAMFKFSGKRALFFFILITRAYPPVTTLIPIYFVVRYLGLMDSKVGLIILYTSLQMSLIVWVMRSFFVRIPKEIMECALIDGGSLGDVFFRIALPLSAPGLVASGVLVWILYWNEFLMALVLTSTSAAKTVPVAISSYLVSEGKAHWGSLSALGLLGVIPALLILGITGKYLVKGLMAGAVKE